MYRQIYFSELLLYTEKHKVVITEQFKKKKPSLQSFGGCSVDNGKVGLSRDIREKGIASSKNTSLVNCW